MNETNPKRTIFEEPSGHTAYHVESEHISAANPPSTSKVDPEVIQLFTLPAAGRVEPEVVG
jgi:hypothetical protein